MSFQRNNDLIALLISYKNSVMCGIIGGRDLNNRIDQHIFDRMCTSLAHRGPDDSGVWFSPRGDVALGQRRLAIIDLSPGGHQPMERDGLHITFNGEIYNYLEIKNELQKRGVRFTSDSDTEVLIQAWRAWKVDALHKFRGMWAFGMWDSATRELILCRDRAGVKPLYYYWDGSLLLFASEIRALLAHPRVARELDMDAVALFLQRGYIPAPMSIFKNIRKLEAGHIMTLASDGSLTDTRYWNATDAYRNAPDRSAIDEETAVRELEAILTESFALRLVADVPVGVFLSGGVDSSLVTALLQKKVGTLKTYTIGFDEQWFDEAPYARRVAEHLHTDHHERYCSMTEAKRIIPRLPEIFDEPFADSSAIPTFLVSEFGRSDVTVALSADGGDELFAGYDRYPYIADLFKRFDRFPYRLARHTPFASLLLRRFGRGRALLASDSLAGIEAATQSVFPNDAIRRLLASPAPSDTTRFNERYLGRLALFDPITQLQAADFALYMQDDILAKADRTTMAVALEGREPFLDPRIIEYAASLPLRFKYKDGVRKYILKEILYRHVPREIVDRPKKGFSAPIEQWLKTDLKHLLDEYLSADRVHREGIFDPDTVASEVSQFLAGVPYRQQRIWTLLMFQMWKERWM